MSGRKRTGTVERHGDHWDVRPTLADGSRGDRLCQPLDMTRDEAVAKAQALTDLAQKTGRVRTTTTLVQPEPAPATETFAAWSDRWCADRERRGLSSVDDDRGRLKKWIVPVIGDMPASTFTQADLERLVEKLDEQVLDGALSWKTAKNAWGIVTKACDDMVRAKTGALRVRKDNPAKLVRGPDEGVVKSKAYLYPAEFLALVRCERVPIRWRRLIALSVYTFTRAGELEALGLDDVSLDARAIHVHRSIDRSDGGVKETKTNNPRRVPIEPALLPLITALANVRAAAPRLVSMPPACDLSVRLRQYLLWAGVTRAELHANDATRKQMTWHDLRATGITWMAVRGDEPLRIMHRAGHENMSTTLGYVREAEALDYLRTEVFPPLPDALILPDVLPEGPSDWAILRENVQKTRVPSGIRTRAQDHGSEISAAFLPASSSVRCSNEEHECAEIDARAESGQNDRSPPDAWPDLLAAAAERAQIVGGDEGTMLALWAEEHADLDGQVTDAPSTARSAGVPTVRTREAG